MSIQTYQNYVSRTMKEIADLEKKLADEKKKEVSKSNEIGRIERSITNYTSDSLLRSKQQQIMRISDEISRIQSKKADLSKKLADKTSQLHRYNDQLSREQERERKKIHDVQKRREREQLEHQRTITRELKQQRIISSELNISQAIDNKPEPKEFDAFISYASEDKNDFVRPLAEALKNAEYKIWYDEFELKVGDSLRRSIDHGLASSRYGIVIFSSFFFQKNWPQYELDGLVSKEMEGKKVILPIWHKVSKDEVRSYSPSLADKVALNSSIYSIDEIVSHLGEVLKRD